LLKKSRSIIERDREDSKKKRKGDPFIKTRPDPQKIPTNWESWKKDSFQKRSFTCYNQKRRNKKAARQKFLSEGIKERLGEQERWNVIVKRTINNPEAHRERRSEMAWPKLCPVTRVCGN